MLSKKTGWDQSSGKASQSCLTQSLTPENLLAMRHEDQHQPWCNSTDITGTVLRQKLFLWEEVLYFKMKKIQKQPRSRIQWMAPFMRMESFGIVDWILNCHCYFFFSAAVLERFCKKMSFHTHRLIPHSTYQWHYPPLASHTLSYPYQDTHTHASARTLW